jgi:uncharacterized Zn-binding protein involved in type VI secretion
MTNRATIDEQAQIILGDKTSHGGVVVSGSPTSSWHGIPIVRKGDKVTCPKCKPHIFVVSEGFEHRLDFGLPMSVHGHKTSCGATLIAAGANANQIEAAMAFVNNKPVKYDRKFQILDDVTKEPMAGYKYKIHIDENIIEGVTDAQGMTQLAESDAPLSVKIEVFGKDA